MYESRIRAYVAEQINRGKPLIIDIETGEYELSDDSLGASMRLLAKQPGAALYGMRVGYPAFVKAGGGWTNLLNAVTVSGLQQKRID